MARLNVTLSSLVYGYCKCSSHSPRMSRTRTREIQLLELFRLDIVGFSMMVQAVGWNLA
jgi:hypothetical protein